MKIKIIANIEELSIVPDETEANSPDILVVPKKLRKPVSSLTPPIPAKPEKAGKPDKEAMKRDLLAGDKTLDLARKYSVSLGTVYQLRSKMKAAGEIPEDEG